MDETRLLYSRLDDALDDSLSGECSFLGFLNEVECSRSNDYLKSKGVPFNFYGGYDTASRVFLAISRDGCSCYDVSAFPISCICIKASGNPTLTHRDYLGSLMGLGIKREFIGDIIPINNFSALVFVRNEIKSYIIDQLDKVGRFSVVISEYQGSTDNLSTNTEEIDVIVTSMRIDNVVGACANVSRALSTELIEHDKVFVNYSIPTKVSQLVHFGDTVSIRGYGKYKIIEQVKSTKKDRLVIKVLHYI